MPNHGGITSKRSGGPGRINWVAPSEASGVGAAGKKGETPTRRHRVTYRNQVMAWCGRCE